MPPAQAHQRGSPLARTPNSARSPRTPGSTRAQEAATIRWAGSVRTVGASTTCTATFGSGVRTGSDPIRAKRRLTRKGPSPAGNASSATEAGSMSRKPCAAPTATAILRNRARQTSACGWSGVSNASGSGARPIRMSSAAQGRRQQRCIHRKALTAQTDGTGRSPRAGLRWSADSTRCQRRFRNRRLGPFPRCRTPPGLRVSGARRRAAAPRSGLAPKVDPRSPA